MSAPRARVVRIGALVVVGLALFMIGTFLIGREQRLWERKVPFEVRFTRTNGLRIGAPVSLAGVDIGSVEDVSFPEVVDAKYVSISISVIRGAAARIREDSVAQIRTTGLLGDKYIEVGAGSIDAAPLAAGAIIPSVDPLDYEALIGEGGDVITNIVEASNSLKSVFAAIDRGEGLLGQLLKDREQSAAMLGHLRTTLAHLEETSSSVARIAGDVERGKGAIGVLLKRGDEVETLLANLSKTSMQLADLSARLNRAEGALPRLLEDREYGQKLLDDLQRATHELAELAELAEKANRGSGTVAKLVNDPKLAGEVKGLVTTTRSSWAFKLYRGLSGLFPGGGAPEEPAPETSEAEATPSPP